MAAANPTHLVTAPIPVIAGWAVPAPPGVEVHVPILVYHSFRHHFPHETPLQKEFDVEPDTFAQQLDLLRARGYTSVSFDDLADAFDGRRALPDRSVIISIDDGWESQYTDAYTLLRTHGFTATFFLYTNVIGHAHFVTWPQVQEMAVHGMIIGAHTKSHPRLDRLTNTARLREEIIGGKQTLESELGQPVTAFAYPFGRFTPEVVDVVGEAGFRIARSGTPRHVRARDLSAHHAADRFILDSIEVPNSVARLASMLGE